MTNRSAQHREDSRARNNLRVLVIAPSLDILGGQAVQAARLVSRLREESFINCQFQPINPRLPGLLRVLQSIKYLRTVVTSLVYVMSLIVRVPSYDVLHVFSASYFSFVLAPTPAILMGKLFRKKVILNYHSGEARDHLMRWPSSVATLRLADSIVVPSNYLVKIFSEFGLRAEAISNIVEVREFTFRARQIVRPIFLSNRNFEKHYGVDCVLRAFAVIQERVPDAELIVAGDGPDRVELQALAKSLDLRHTTFAGRVEHEAIVEQYRRADIYLNGSLIDNQPLSIIEAFACGLPIVTTNAGGIPDMVTDGINGFVVDCGDHERMAERAVELVENPELRHKFAEAGKRECEQYSWTSVRDRWLKTYAQPTQRGSRLKRIGQMSAGEICARTAQKLAVLAERNGLSAQTALPSDRALAGLLSLQPAVDVVKWFRQRQTSSFFASLASERTLIELRRRFPDAEPRIINEAEAISAGTFKLFNREFSFGKPINWRLEPLTKRETPLVHWSRIDYLNTEVVGDKKITWELNRHQHFVRLGQAYWLTRDEKYAATFVAQLESWFEANPPKFGINWASSLEVSFRSISWLWALEFFKHSPTLTAATLNRVVKFLYLHARHLETYLSTYFSPNTHLTGEALGLFYLGTLLPEFKDASRWRETGRRILIEQLSRQVREDGVYFEQSSYYHRYTVDFYTHFFLLSQREDSTTQKLQALLDHLMYITRPDGTTPLFGDDDGGRLITFDARAANDFRPALSTGAVLFNRDDYKYVAGDFAEESLWLLGAEGARAFDELDAVAPLHESKAFPNGGYYVMRDSWSADANYLLFDCGPDGTDNCGHAHADALAFELAVNGQRVLTDPGTHTYTGSPELRDWFRSSRAHNTLAIDGASSSVPAGPFSWKSIASCEAKSWISERRFDFVEGQHNGYQRLIDAAIHTRSILFLKNDYWIVRDHIASAGQHLVELPFHFVSESEVASTLSGSHLIAKLRGNATFSAFCFGNEGQWSREPGWVSHCYLEREDAPVLVFSARMNADGEVVTFLLPLGSQRSTELHVKEVEAVGGRAFEIRSGERTDLVSLRDRHSKRVESVRIASTFAWTWTRFSTPNAELPEEWVVIDGDSLELDGKQILNSTKRVNYLVANRVGSKFRLETPDGRIDFALPIRNLESLFPQTQNQRTLKN